MHRLTLLVALCALIASRATADTPSPLATLQTGDFAAAMREAQAAITTNKNDARAHAVLALSRYRVAGEQLFSDLATVIESLERHRGINAQYLKFALTQFEGALKDVDGELAEAARDKDFSLDLCLACWRVDWNRNGRIDSRDERLFEIEIDSDGNELPEGDPRRRPTFRFDAGDLWWARAMVGFQHALVEMGLAYRWSDLEQILQRKGAGPEAKQKPFVIHLDDKKRLPQARERLLAGLDAADAARKAYLAEKDDQREWLPNPRQKNHPMPLAVDDELYRTWEGITNDVRRLAKSQDGLAIGELFAIARRNQPSPDAPRGVIDLGRIFSDPKDIVVSPRDLEQLNHVDRATDASLRNLLGSLYLPAGKLKPTPLVNRLKRMNQEVEHGHESLARKLRYLLWLN